MRLLPLFLSTTLLLAPAHAEEYTFDADLDIFLDFPGSFEEVTVQSMEAAFPEEEGFKDAQFRYSWLTADKTRAHFKRKPFGNITINFTIFGGQVPVEEAVVDFEDGKFLGGTFSLYNRGDSGEIAREEFTRRYQTTGKEIGQRLGARPFLKKANPNAGLLTEGYLWTSEQGMAILEHNEGATGSEKMEFLRLRVMRRDARGPLAAAMRARSGAAVKLSELPANLVKEEDGSLRIDHIPMVDQGPKGYCVVASAQRLFEYYGIPCDMHQLAAIAGADAARGTSSVAMAEGLKKIVYRFKTRFKVLCLSFTDGNLREVDNDLRGEDVFTAKTFAKEVRRYIDDGIPLLWSLQLGKYPEEPAISPQSSGGHMRIITGYNDDTGQILFSDSWGAGHEVKRMAEDDAFRATTGLFVLHPTVR